MIHTHSIFLSGRTSSTQQSSTVQLGRPSVAAQVRCSSNQVNTVWRWLELAAWILLTVVVLGLLGITAYQSTLIP